MAYKVLLLKEAQREYRSILDFLVNVAKSPQAATSFADEVEHQVALIAGTPELYELSRFPVLSARGFRTCLVKNYVMLYTVREGSVFIVHIFHQSQDYAKFV